MSRLVYISDNSIWRGEEIDGVKHPLSIEYLWSDEELSNIGLKRFVDPVIEPLPTQPQVPYSVTPRQVRLLLLQQNLLTDVEALIAQQDEATKIAWEYASEFRRDDPLLNQLAQNLNLTQEQLDQFFVAAATL